MRTIATTETSARAPLLVRPSGRSVAGAFTLLEVILATVILVTALSVVIESLSMSLQSASETYRRQYAQDLAADKLARACAGEMTALPSEGQQEHQGRGYQWHVERASDVGDRPQRIACKVLWRGRGQSHTVVVQRCVLTRGQGVGGS